MKPYLYIATFFKTIGANDVSCPLVTVFYYYAC